MSRSTSTRAELSTLALLGLLAAGLWGGPESVDSAVRGVVRDALFPGQACVVACAERGLDIGSSLFAGHAAARRAEAIDDLESELTRWRSLALGLQVRNAELHAQLETVEATRRFPAAVEATPLLVPDLLEARVLGSERPLLERRMSRILNRGAADDVLMDDLVLADDVPHLDQGSVTGVAADELVLRGAVIVGRIREVGRWTSTVELVTSTEYRGVAQLVRPSGRGAVFGAEGILVGAGDDTCRLELVSAVEPVAAGDYVYLPGRVTALRRPACYGRVVDAELAEGASYWSITVQPCLSAGEFSTVQVLREVPNPLRMAESDTLADTVESGRIWQSVLRMTETRSPATPR